MQVRVSTSIGRDVMKFIIHTDQFVILYTNNYKASIQAHVHKISYSRVGQQIGLCVIGIGDDYRGANYACVHVVSFPDPQYDKRNETSVLSFNVLISSYK